MIATDVVEKFNKYIDATSPWQPQPRTTRVVALVSPAESHDDWLQQLGLSFQD
jgi:hypothetical protein